MRGATAASVFAAVSLLGCSNAARQEAAPEPGPKAEAADTPAFQSVTRQKFKDEEYVAAIAALESANPAAEAESDLASNRRRLLGVPRSSGEQSELPGVGMPREQIPESVPIVRIAGIVSGSSKPHLARYEMLARRYATEYNRTMFRGVR